MVGLVDLDFIVLEKNKKEVEVMFLMEKKQQKLLNKKYYLLFILEVWKVFLTVILEYDFISIWLH